jgi:LacI family transcriptional regulator
VKSKSSPTVARNVTILDIAESAGVSKSTVSLVMKGSELIRPETAARVRAVAEDLGYVYNRHAAQMRSNTSNMIGVVINDLMNPFFAEVLVGIERKLVREGFITLMAHSCEDVGLQGKLLTSMREQNAAGIMLCPALETPATLLKQMSDWRIPIVLMVRPLGRVPHDYVGSDNVLGTRMSTRYLIEKGNKRIGFIGGQSGTVFRDRLKGYQDALEEAGLPFDESCVVSSPPTRDGGFSAMLKLLASRRPATAAICYNDITALGALAALGSQGLKAGEDFAIIGFDGILDTEHSNPPLTTIDIQPSMLGEQAASLMLQRIAEPDGKPRKQLVKPSLKVRTSA